MLELEASCTQETEVNTTWSTTILNITNMKAAVTFVTLAVAMPAVCGIFTSGGTGFGFPFVTLGSTTTTTGTGTASGLAISGLSVGTATLAGFGGVLAAIGIGGALGGLAAAATRRGKRSVEAEADIGEQFIFDSMAAVDTKDCGKRYLCEVAATPVSELSQEEFSSLLLFSANGSLGGSKAVFNEAVRLGAVSRSHEACLARYSSCPAVSNFKRLSSKFNRNTV